MGPSSQFEVGSVKAESEGDRVEAEFEGDSAVGVSSESVSSESQEHSAARSQSVDNAAVAKSEGDTSDGESEASDADGVSSESEGSNATSSGPVLHTPHEETVGAYGSNLNQSQVWLLTVCLYQFWSRVHAGCCWSHVRH